MEKRKKNALCDEETTENDVSDHIKIVFFFNQYMLYTVGANHKS